MVMPTSMLVLLTLPQPVNRVHRDQPHMSGFISAGTTQNAFACPADGCRIDFGPGASDYIAFDDTDVVVSAAPDFKWTYADIRTMLVDVRELREELSLLERRERNQAIDALDRFEAFRENTASAYAAGICALIFVIVVIERRFLLKTKELQRRFESSHDHCINARQVDRDYVYRLEKTMRDADGRLGITLGALIDDKTARDARDEEARDLTTWVNQNHQYNPKYECFDHGSCALPPGHGKGKTEVTHEDHVGHRWTTRHNVFDPTED